MKFMITPKELFLVFLIGFMGFMFSSRSWILYLNSQDPIKGLLIYYVILYSSMFFLSKLGLIVFNIRIINPIQVLGLILITFAFFIVIDWESPYINLVTKGNVENVSNVYFQSEDGATWHFWSRYFKDTEQLRILTYVITPILLSFIGCLLVSQVRLLG